jgi:hypothetical protein
MQPLPKGLASDKANSAPAAGLHEFLITSLRAASARARLQGNLFDTIGVSLKHRMVTDDEAVAWLMSEGLLEHVEYKPGMVSKVEAKS